MPKTSSTEKAHRAATKARHAPVAVPTPAEIDEMMEGAREALGVRRVDPPQGNQRDAAEAAKLLSWARANGFPLLRVKVGEVEIDLGMPLTAPAPPSAPRTRMTPPGPADTRNLYEAFGGEALERAREAMGIDDDGDPEDDDEPAIPHPRDRRPRRR
jgi:hypothetical protein